MRILFIGTPNFALPSLKLLINKKYEIIAVITQPDRPKGRNYKLIFSPVKELAIKHNIFVLQPLKINDKQFISKIKVLAPDMIVVVAFGQLLSKEILEIPKYGCVNVHASILPYYRGAAPIHWAIINGEKTTGITIILMDQGMDTGDIILKKQVKIYENETTGKLHDRLCLLGGELLIDAIELIKNNKLSFEQQNHNIATYAPKLNRKIEKICWDSCAQKIHNLVRGLNPSPGAYTFHNNQQLKILKTQIFSSKINCSPGTIISILKQGFIVETKQGQLEVQEVQPINKKKMTANEYIQGHMLRVGQKLG